MSGSFEFLLLGDPVEHSRSPRIHLAGLAELGLSGIYEARATDEAGLGRAINELRNGAISGINVTMPLKHSATRACDHLTDEAAASKSVNTLRCRDGQVEGHSTDVVAARSILARDSFAGDSPLLVLGAGGAAAAVLAAAESRLVYVSARDRHRADEIAGWFDHVVTVRFGTPVGDALIINATPLGMRGETLPEGIIEVSSGLVDLAYGTNDTPAVSHAGDLGLPVVDGLEFLAIQATASFEWWTGEVAPLTVMLDAARKH